MRYLMILTSQLKEKNKSKGIQERRKNC